jgi:hypothetical protein
MKKNLAALLCFITAPSVFAQGSLTPPGAPAPSMKTLQQIYDRLDQLAATVSNQQRHLDYLAASIGFNTVNGVNRKRGQAVNSKTT